jgi:ABC-type multidrug transport system fused ATPase/permease subunit
VRDLWTILRLVRRSLRGSALLAFGLAAGLSALAGATAGVLPGLVGVAVSDVLGRPSPPSTGLAGLFARLIAGTSAWTVIAATLVAIVITVGISVASSRAGSQLAGEVTAALRVELVRAALWASPRAVEAAGAAAVSGKGGPPPPPGLTVGATPGKPGSAPTPPGAKMPAVRGSEAVKLVIARDTSAVADFAMAMLTGLPQTTVTLVVLAWELYSSGASVVLAGAAGLFVLSRLLSDRASRRVGERMAAMQRADTVVFGALGEMLAGTEELRLLGARDTALGEFQGAAHRAADARRSFAAALATSGQIKSVISAMSPLLILIALRLSGRGHEAGDVAKLLLVVPLLLARFEALDGLRTGLVERGPLLRSLVGLLALPPHPPAPAEPVPLAKLTDGAVVFDEVTYAPEGAGKNVLERLSLRIPDGAVVAVVGASGSGKSTLLRLLLRLDDPGAGQIRVGGVALRELDPRDLPRLFAVLGQASRLFERSVAQNLALGLEAPPAEASLREMLARVKLDDLAEGKGRDLSTEFRAVPPNFSGGEQRRIMLARMLLRDARVLVLDEPEAGLPAATAEELLHRVVELAGGRTTIVVTHAPHLVRSTFNVVIDEGRVAAVGKHEELVQSSELYRSLLSEGQRRQAATPNAPGPGARPPGLAGPPGPASASS